MGRARSTPPTAKERQLSRYHHRQQQQQKTTGTIAAADHEDQRTTTIPAALAVRSFHLPGNNAAQDWIQYLANNHPVIGICCHDRMHPITFWPRVVNLIGSVAFGLAITNLIWIVLIMHHDGDPNQPVMTISFNSNGQSGGSSSSSDNNSTTTPSAAAGDDAAASSSFATPTFLSSSSSDNSYANSNSDGANGEIQITQAMVALWTVGTSLHAIFDTSIWYISACMCCLPGQALERLDRYRWCGTYFVIVVVVILTAVATCAVVLRAAIDDNDQDGDDATMTSNSTSYTNGTTNSSDIDIEDDDRIYLNDVPDAAAFDFLISYAIELALALFVYWPIFATILFSGCLGRGRVPVLGGRPYELKQEQRRYDRDEESNIPPLRKT